MATVKSQFTLRLDTRTYDKIRKIADTESRSLTKMIEYLIKREIQSFESQNGEIELFDQDMSDE